jgi:NADP-dependent 3-hydroxy acid dehydrogenase YdfG
MTDLLHGTVALVTGASSGIGEATAEALAAEGAAVSLVARRKDRLDDLAARIAKEGGRAEVLERDITDRAAAEAAVADTVGALGRLDIVINNAGVMLLGPAADADVDEWQRMVELNVLGLLYVARASTPHLLHAAESDPRRVADLVNVSSVAGRVARSGSAVYNATKFAVNAFSEGLRQEVTGRHLRVGLIEPGAVDTELSSHNRPEVREMMAKRFGHIERLESEDIARSVVYMVTQPRHAAVNEILIRPTEQEG